MTDPPAETTPAGSAAPEASARGIVGWTLAFWLLWALSVVAAFLRHGGDGVGSLPLTLALLGVIGAAFALLGEPASRCGSPLRGRAYLAILVATLGVLAVVSPGLLFLLFIAFSQVWFLTENRREGVAFTVALAASVGTGLAVQSDSVVGVGVSYLSMGVSLLFSLLLGLWISSIIDQSTERADLIAQLETTRSDLARAHHDAGVVAERERLAREIHDTIAQELTSIVMMSQVASRHLDAGRDTAAAATVAGIEDSARSSLADARALVASYSAVGVDDGLPAALRRLAARFAAETGIQVAVEVAREGDGSRADAVGGGADAVSRPAQREQEVVLLRTAQEGLANVRKHAAASRVRIVLGHEDDGGLSIEIEDDGVGFDASPDGRGGVGLDGLSRRAAEVGGALAVTSTAGAGTRLRVSVPQGAPGRPGGAADGGWSEESSDE